MQKKRTVLPDLVPLYFEVKAKVSKPVLLLVIPHFTGQADRCGSSKLNQEVVLNPVVGV